MTKSKNKDYVELDLETVKNFASKYGVLVSMVVVLGLALWLRTFTMKYEYLQAIDPFYLSRMTETLINNNFHLPSLDPLRYFPDGFNPRTEGYLLYYLYGLIYVLFAKTFSVDFFTYSKAIPAVFGSLIIIPVYFIGKELFDRKTGVFAAFFYAVSPAVLFRTSAGFFEKEPIGGFFMFTTVWFTLRALRRNSFLDSLVAGFSLLYAAILWGGTSAIFLSLAAIFSIFILTGKYPQSLWKTYSGLALFTVVMVLVNTRYKFTSSTVLGFLGVYVLLTIIEILKIKGKLKQEQLPVGAPVVVASFSFLVLVSSLFLPQAKSLINTVMSIVLHKKGVIGSTVAENIDATWRDFTVRLGTEYAKPALAGFGLESITPVFALWLFSFIAVLLLVYDVFREKEKNGFFYTALISALIALYGIFAFLNTSSNKSRITFIYVLSFVVLSYILSRENYKYGLITIFYFSTILAFFSRIRVIFIVGPFVAVLGAFAISKIIDLIKNLNKGGWRAAIKYFAIVFIVSTLIVNIIAGHTLAKALSPSFTKNWDEAMTFLREETPENSSILSWWDFGYWFQTMGQRASLLDGGNQYGDRNVEAARYFTGWYNETEQLLYLKKWNPTHILVDASMIGKYAAMSKIANQGEKIDAYMQMRMIKAIPKGNVTIFDYKYGYLFDILVPVNTKDGSIAGKILFVDNRNGYRLPIKYICQDKPIQITNDPSAIPGCVIISREMLLFASEDIMNSPFNRIFVMDLYGIDYLEKVFDNGEIKIFKVNYEKIDELLNESRSLNSTSLQTEQINTTTIHQ